MKTTDSLQVASLTKGSSKMEFEKTLMDQKNTKIDSKPEKVFKLYQAIQEKYIITSVLKEDFKGNVYKAIYFTGFMHPGFCVIKQGREFRSADKNGRDMTDRVAWQHKIHHELEETVKLPGLIGYFIEEGDHYLVTQNIKGETLEKVIRNVYKERSWLQLSIGERNKLLKLFLKILDLIKTVHHNGFVHRDLNHANFIVTVSGDVFLIDWELAYGLKEKYPLPAFKLGTYGFMSPEQLNGNIPTVKEDIYALGALMIVFFTNMAPIKFDLQNLKQIRKMILFFTDDILVESLILKCLSPNPAERPEISFIEDVIRLVIENPKTIPQEKLHSILFLYPNKIEINELLHSCYNGLVHHEVTKDNGLLKLLGAFDLKTGERNGRGISMGLMSPILGILMVLANEKDIQDEVLQFFRKFFQHNRRLFTNVQKENITGLYSGTAGQALCLYYGWKLGVLPADYKIREGIDKCFSCHSAQFDLAEGIAGQFIVLCKIHQGGFPHLKEQIMAFAEIILQRQSKDGSWPVSESSGNKGKLPTGLENGIAGILMALIQFDKILPAENTKTAIQKGFCYIIRNEQFKKFKIQQSSTELDYSKSMAFGTAGLALAFLYGFEHFGDNEYKERALKYLKGFTPYQLSQDFSLASGLSGIGVLYIEAARILEEPKWLDRASWIYQIFKNTIHEKGEGSILWITGALYEYDVGMLSGMAGMVLFLQKIRQIDQ